MLNGFLAQLWLRYVNKFDIQKQEQTPKFNLIASLELEFSHDKVRKRFITKWFKIELPQKFGPGKLIEKN